MIINLNINVMTKAKIYEIIKIVATAIISIAATLLVESCTMSMSISKNNTNSNQSTEQSHATSVDSTKVDLQVK